MEVSPDTFSWYLLAFGLSVSSLKTQMKLFSDLLSSLSTTDINPSEGCFIILFLFMVMYCVLKYGGIMTSKLVSNFKGFQESKRRKINKSLPPKGESSGRNSFAEPSMPACQNFYLFCLYPVSFPLLFSFFLWRWWCRRLDSVSGFSQLLSTQGNGCQPSGHHHHLHCKNSSGKIQK